MRCAGLVLAAGAGRRLGEPKALVEIDDERLVDRAVSRLRSGGVQSVFVVVGAADVGVVDAVVVRNDDWCTGMASSLRAGLFAVAAGDPAVDAAVIILVDQPGLTADAVRSVIAAATAGGAPAAVATYGGVRGHPVLIRREAWEEVARTAVGDEGARRYLAAAGPAVIEVPCGALAAAADVDTPAELAAARARHRGSAPRRTDP